MKFCIHCGRELPEVDAPACPVCKRSLTAAPALRVLRGVSAGQPGLRRTGRWLRSGIAGTWRPATAGILCAWSYLPVALLLGALGAAAGALAGFASGGVLGKVVTERLDLYFRYVLPIGVDITELVPSWGWQIGGPVGAMLGAVWGALKLGWLALAGPVELLSATSGPTAPISTALGQVITALILGGLYTVIMVAAERPILTAGDLARPAEPREAAALDPIVADIAARIGARAVPLLLIADDGEPWARGHARHLVVSTGLMRAYAYQPARLAAVIAHALACWVDGQAVAAHWLRGVCLPLWGFYELAASLLARTTDTRARPLAFMIRVLLWPFLVTVRAFVAPVARRAWKRRIIRADQLTAAAGYGPALREAILDHPPSPAGLGRWDAATQAYPAVEQRLTALGGGADLRSDLTRQAVAA